MSDNFLASYIETALWSSVDAEGVPLDDVRYADAELSEETRSRMRRDCADFESKIEPILSALDDSILRSLPNSDRIAHDFWLTRNHHGAGFWDGEYPKALGQTLTEIAHDFGDFCLYVGDDGSIYGERG